MAKTILTSKNQQVYNNSGSFKPTENIVDPTLLPRWDINSLTYTGAFAIPANNWSRGRIAMKDNGNIFIDGLDSAYTISEVSLPDLVKTFDYVADLNISTVVQAYEELWDRVPVVGGMLANIRQYGLYYDNSIGLINTIGDYYDNASLAENLLVINTPDDLANTTIKGLMKLDGQRHSSGWINEIPVEWQGVLGGTHLSGSSCGDPFTSIQSTHTLGPSLFSFNLSDITVASDSDVITTNKLMDYPITNPLMPISDMTNKDGTNQLWTHFSKVDFAMIIPNTRTYACFGANQGTYRNEDNPHKDTDGAIYYKGDGKTNDLGHTVDGFNVWDHKDKHLWFWLYDLNDITSATNPHDPRPYSYGKLPVTPFKKDDFPLSGQRPDHVAAGAYNKNDQTLYLSMPFAGDRTTNASGLVTVSAFKLGV